MLLARYRTRDRASRLGQEAVKRGEACLAGVDPAGATRAFGEALEALTYAHGVGHEQTLPGHSGLGAAAFQAGEPGEDPYANYQPDFWLVASADGQNWMVEDLAEAESPGQLMAINGQTLLISGNGTDGLTWRTITLP